MKCVEAQKLMDLYLADDPLLSLAERLRLEEHLHGCSSCRAEYEQGHQVASLIRQYGQISEDTRALLAGVRAPTVTLRVSWDRHVLRVGIVAACLVIAVLGWWVISSPEVPMAISKGPVAPSGEGTLPTIESIGSDGPILPGTTIQTCAEEIRSLILNGKHQVVMNAGTRLSIEPVVATGRVGCQVNLALGEVYVHVTHDGNLFVVRTAHGRAVITGTTFNVKAMEAGTTLVVTEGSVQFESEGGVVQVTAGQQSMIVRASESPSTPTICDATALTAWAGACWSVDPVAKTVNPEDILVDSLPVFPPSGVRTDFQGIRYAEWIEQNCDWFRRRFPETFRLAEALAQERVNVKYPDLLFDSGLVWQFAWPPAGPQRLLAADDAAIIRAAARHGRDLQWLKDRSLLPGLADPVVEQASGLDAFSRWQKQFAAVSNTGGAAPVKSLLDSLQACDHLRYTRLLIWLAIEAGQYTPPEVPGQQLQDLLRAEILSTDRWTNDCLRLLTVERSNVLCDGDSCWQLVQRLHDMIAEIMAVEGRIADEMENHRP